MWHGSWETRALRNATFPALYYSPDGSEQRHLVLGRCVSIPCLTGLQSYATSNIDPVHRRIRALLRT
jgi:hypothetical protein